MKVGVERGEAGSGGEEGRGGYFPRSVSHLRMELSREPVTRVLLESCRHWMG